MKGKDFRKRLLLMALVLAVTALFTACRRSYLSYRYALDESLEHNSITIKLEELLYRPEFYARETYHDSRGHLITREASGPSNISISFTIENPTYRGVEIKHARLRDGVGKEGSIILTLGWSNFTGGVWHPSPDSSIEYHSRSGYEFIIVPPHSKETQRLDFNFAHLTFWTRIFNLTIEDVHFIGEEEWWDYRFERVRLGKRVAEEFDPFDPTPPY